MEVTPTAVMRLLADRGKTWPSRPSGRFRDLMTEARSMRGEANIWPPGRAPVLSSNSTMAALLQIRWAMDLDDLALMRRIDELHLDYPFAGSQMLQTFLVREVAA